MKKLAAACTIAGALASTGCGLFGSSEAVREGSGRSVYRAAEEAPPDLPDYVPARGQVPGEKR